MVCGSLSVVCTNSKLLIPILRLRFPIDIPMVESIL